MRENWVEWRRSEETTLIDMKQRGYTYYEIGRVLHRTACAVQSHYVYMCRREGSYKPKSNHHWRADELADVREMYTNGAKCREIAAKYGVTKWAVYTQLAKMRKEGSCENRYKANH